MYSCLGPKGLPLALLKVTIVNGDVTRLAEALTRYEEGQEELGKDTEDILGEGLQWVAIGKGEDSFQSIPDILACRATGDQLRDEEVHQIPQLTILTQHATCVHLCSSAFRGGFRECVLIIKKITSQAPTKQKHVEAG